MYLNSPMSSSPSVSPSSSLESLFWPSSSSGLSSSESLGELRDILMAASDVVRVSSDGVRGRVRGKGVALRGKLKVLDVVCD